MCGGKGVSVGGRRRVCGGIGKGCSGGEAHRSHTSARRELPVSCCAHELCRRGPVDDHQDRRCSRRDECLDVALRGVQLVQRHDHGLWAGLEARIDPLVVEERVEDCAQPIIEAVDVSRGGERYDTCLVLRSFEARDGAQHGLERRELEEAGRLRRDRVGVGGAPRKERFDGVAFDENGRHRCGEGSCML